VITIFSAIPIIMGNKRNGELLEGRDSLLYTSSANFICALHSYLGTAHIYIYICSAFNEFFSQIWLKLGCFSQRNNEGVMYYPKLGVSIKRADLLPECNDQLILDLQKLFKWNRFCRKLQGDVQYYGVSHNTKRAVCQIKSRLLHFYT
jgi:hypothetical protein